MKKFPEIFIPSNKDKFPNYLYERNLCYMRRDIYESLLKEEDFYDLEAFNKKYVDNLTVTKRLSKQIVDELVQKGWKVSFLFGETALCFEDKIPKSTEIDSEAIFNR